MGAQSEECADRLRVSVIIIFLDGEAFLSEAIESVIAQSFENWELLLVDDGSGPAATAIAKTYVSRFPQKIRYLEHPGHVNRGMSATRNVGIQHARGEFIAFIDADDIWLPSKLAEQVAILDAHPEVGMVCSASICWNGSTTDPGEIVSIGHQQDTVIPPPDPIIALYPLGTIPPACPSGIMVRTDLARRLGGFEEEFRGHLEDQAFFSKVYLTEAVYFSSSPLFRYRRHPDSSTGVLLKSAQNYHDSKLRFLEWLETYLHNKPGKTDARITSSLQRALLYYRKPRVHFLISLPSRLRNGYRRWSGRFSRLIGRQAP